VGITYGIRHLLYIKPTFVRIATITVSFIISKLCIEHFSILRINKMPSAINNYEPKLVQTEAYSAEVENWRWSI
jgi:hypothetical protein